MVAATRLGSFATGLIVLGTVAVAALVWIGLASRSGSDPRPDPRMEEARALHARGSFEEARRALAPVLQDGDAPLEAVRGMAELEYLLGRYAEAEHLLRQVVELAGPDAQTRAEAEAALALVYYQTGEFNEATGLFSGLEGLVELPIWELMTQVADRPYQIDWQAMDQTELPFLQTTSHDLPRVAISVGGRQIEAVIDTGGDLLTLPTSLVAELGIEPVVTFEGSFAGGGTAEQGYAVLDELSLAEVTIRNVPITIGVQETAVIGTGLLRRFLPTLDYPGGRLVLRPKGTDSMAPTATEVPFALALTHLMVVDGSLDDADGLTFMVDSGLVDTEGGSFIAPAATLELAEIPIPDTEALTGESGAGTTTLEVGRFPIRRIGLGPLSLADTTGLYGVFPAQLGHEATGFTIHGSISHHFLRSYEWTIDFDRMVMVFTNV